MEMNRWQVCGIGIAHLIAAAQPLIQGHNPWDIKRGNFKLVLSTQLH